MGYHITEELEALRRTVRAIARDRIAPGAGEREEKGDYPWDMVQLFREHQFYALTIPESYGGLRGRMLDFCIVMEEVCRVCNNCGAMLSLNGLGPYPIILSGSEEQKGKYLPRFATGEILGSYALSEPDAGSDAASLRTKAVLGQDGYVIWGTKCFVSNFDVSSIMILFARTNPDVKPSRGISAFVVETGPEEVPPGVSIVRAMPKMSMRAMHTFELELQGLRVSRESLLGDEGDGMDIALKTLDRGRISVGAQGTGTAQGALDYAANYAKQRKQFGKAIGSFQGIQFMLADMAIETEAARQLVYMAAYQADIGGPNVTLYGAMSKCFATDVAMSVTTNAVQVLGGYGYLKDHPVERLMRDAKAMQIYEGTNQIQRMVIARSLLGRL